MNVPACVQSVLLQSKMINPRIPMRQTARLINGSSRVIRRKPLQPVKRRAYSSGGAHGTTQASSDLPW